MSQLLGLFYFKDMPLVYFILTHPTPDFHLKKVSTFNAKHLHLSLLENWLCTHVCVCEHVYTHVKDDKSAL